MFGSRTKTQEPCLEKAARPQSYFLQEQSFSPSASFPLYVFLFPAHSPKTLGESAASRAVTVNSLFVLLHMERGEGSFFFFYLIDFKIYTSFGQK